MNSESTARFGGHRLVDLLKTHAILLMTVMTVGVGFALLSQKNAAVRVGDGSEYYAMFLAWRDTLRPFMTEPAWQAYQRLFDTHSIAQLQPLAALRGMFPSLDTGHSADLNHFWFYSAAAAAVGRAASTFGIMLSPHASFVLFHWVLATLTLSIAWHGYRSRGVVAASMLLFLSPAIWYVNKVHTEFFTISLTLSATIFFVQRRFLAAALMLAIASTQNISFIAVAAIVLAIDFMKRRTPRRYSVAGAIVLLVTIALMFVHPAYYFSRLGIVTPQLMAGGASVGLHLDTAWLWFLDPDLGLLTNWPIAVIVTCSAVFAKNSESMTVRPISPSLVMATYGELFLYYIGYLTISLLAQSSTVNLNSAATPGLARYGLWYVGLFFPPFLIAVDWAIRGLQANLVNTGRRTLMLRRAATTAFAVGAAIYTVAFFRPSIPEDGPVLGAWHPSWMSLALQTWLPQLYDPPVEVFAERYGGIAESPQLTEALAIVGPDCRKILTQQRESTRVLGGFGCVYADDRLRTVLARRADSAVQGFHYVRLTAQEAQEAQLPLITGTWYSIGTDSIVNGVLGRGWNTVEPWGVWSGTSRANLSFPCASISEARTLTLGLRAFLGKSIIQRHAELRLDGIVMATVDFHVGDPAETLVVIPLSETSCVSGRLLVDIDTTDPVSPSALGMSADSRPLGVALLRFRFDP